MYKNKVVMTSLAGLLVGLSTLPVTANASAECAEILKAPVSLKVLKNFPGVISQKPLPIIISAPSGGGKTTLMKLLVEEFPNNFKFSVSTTTRSPRVGEVNGIDYNFVSVDDFQKMLASDSFVESAKVHANYYGTSKKNVSDAISAGMSPLLLVDVQGAEEIRKKLNGQVYSIFIVPPSLQVLEQRLRGRGTDPDDVIQRRINNAKAEMARQDEFNSVLVNDDLNVAYQNLILILQSIPR